MTKQLSPYIRVDRLDWVVGPQVIFDYEIIYLKSGVMEVIVDQARYMR